ncbi:MAG: cyclase family protein [Candidatus Obscuribacterales bacterium]|nr:cyclase family protein [Candidatus Obscuribacterales bacterium]
MLQYKRLIDISQPVKSDSAAFPGDTPFKREIVLSHKDSQVVNLTALTMSPHVGTHVDAPSHIKGDMSIASELVGQLPLEPFIGEVLLLDFSPRLAGLDWDSVKSKLLEMEKDSAFKWTLEKLPARLIFKTQEKIRYEIFEDDYSFFTSELVAELSKRGVILMGIDAPSADHIKSKTLDAHHELDRLNMYWLENLDLSSASAGEYYLIAFPIKFAELEASPVRAVLLEF